MNDIIHATINGLPVETAPGTTILEAARQVHVRIPTLCKHPDLDATAACGICIVQIKSSGKMLRPAARHRRPHGHPDRDAGDRAGPPFGAGTDAVRIPTSA